MKHVINILVILILVGFAIGLVYVQLNNEGDLWFMGLVPTGVFMLLWGDKLIKDY
jgi:hypothetical protein